MLEIHVSPPSRPASSHLLSTSQQKAAVDTEKSFVLEKRDYNPEKYRYYFEFQTHFFFPHICQLKIKVRQDIIPFGIFEDVILLVQKLALLKEL
jgi:hypothetical protein